MNQFKKLKSLLIVSNLLIMTACSPTLIKDKDDTDICTEIEKNANGSETQVKLFWNDLNNRYEKNRKLVVFMDGTMNKKDTNTNVWRLYKQSLKHACSNKSVNSVIPYYITGLGTTAGNLIGGSSVGLGTGDKIISAYKFLTQTYKEGDEIFIFGFSRGAFTARSLNGMLEYGGLLERNSPNKTIESLYEVYNQSHNGKPSFLKKVKSDLSKEFHKKIQEVKVSAIGVFDTVPAIGYKIPSLSSGRLLYSNPSDHRTDLYAKRGFHAMSLDEQRTAFELLRFPESKGLEEVWFAGGHENIGGHQVEKKPKSSEIGLSKITYDWMISKFKGYDIFPKDLEESSCEKEKLNCEGGRLWDAFFTKPKEKTFWDSFFAKSQEFLWQSGRTFHRKPKATDFIHGSVFCRLEIEELNSNDRHPAREPNGIYTTFFIEKEDRKDSNIVAYQCHKTNN